MLRLRYLRGAIARSKFAPLRLPSSGCYNLRAVIYRVGFGDGARCISLRNPFSREFSGRNRERIFREGGFGFFRSRYLQGAQHGQIFRSDFIDFDSQTER